MTGEILLDENYRQKKWVTFHEYIGKDNYAGFKYGINLKSISRTLDSDGIV
jgi:phage-related protein